MKLDVENGGCQIIQDICKTCCHPLECFSEFPLREKKKAKKNPMRSEKPFQLVS